MVTATERLRELLDERGVFWIDVPLVNMKRTCWKSSEKQDGYCYFDEDAFGVMELTVTSLTPEQAIAATLGAVEYRKPTTLSQLQAENAKLREEAESWRRLTYGLELPEYPFNRLRWEELERENAKLRKLAVGMYGMLEMFDTLLGNHDACETPRPLVFGEDKSFKDAMRELGIEVDG